MTAVLFILEIAYMSLPMNAVSLALHSRQIEH